MPRRIEFQPFKVEGLKAIDLIGGRHQTLATLQANDDRFALDMNEHVSSKSFTYIQGTTISYRV